MTQLPPLRRTQSPTFGQANQPNIAAQQPCPLCDDRALIARKGCLYLLCAPETERDLLLEVARRYYGSTSYDFVPTLCEALAWAYQGEHGYQGRVLLAAVVHDLNLYAVSTVEAEVYIRRADAVTMPLSVHPLHHEVTVPGPDGEHALPLLSTRNRLCLGDCLVLGAKVAPRVVAGALARTRSGEPRAIAERLAAAVRRKARVRAPFIVITMPGLSAIPAVGLISRPLQGDAQAPRQPEPPRPPRPPREGRSPIWIALAFAVVAIAASLWITKPQIHLEDLGEFLTSMLMITPPAATPDATPGAEAPEGSLTPAATPTP